MPALVMTTGDLGEANTLHKVILHNVKLRLKFIVKIESFLFQKVYELVEFTLYNDNGKQKENVPQAFH